MSQPPIKVKLEVLLHTHTHTHKKGVKLEVEILVVNVFWIPMACGMIYVLTCAAERGKSIFSSNYVLPSSDYWAPS